MRKTQHPLVISYGYPVGNEEFHFLGRHGVIRIRNYQKELVRILPLCNGYSNLAELCALLPEIDKGIITKLINVCERHGVVVDSRQLYKRFHEDTVNPGFFMHSLSAAQVARLTHQTLPEVDLTKGQTESLTLLAGTDERSSVRHFAGAPVDSDVIRSLLGSMYRVGLTRSVPSGGGLYPLTLYLVLYIGTEQYKPGIYRHNHYSLELELVKPLPVQDAIERAFDTHELLAGAVGSIIITGDMERSTGKYANRGYRYTILEAGHVAQNAYLFCETETCKGLGVVEYGGFLDEVVAELLGLKYPRYVPIITLVFGVRGDQSEPLVELDKAEQVRQLEASLVGDGKPVVDFGVFELRHQAVKMAQWAASAEYRNPNFMHEPLRNEMAFATGALMIDAVAKVLGEAYERYVCFKPRADIMATASDVGLFVDPQQYAPHSPNHPAYQRYDLVPFQQDQLRAWVYGRDHMGKQIVVPSDLAYYARHPDQPNYCYIPSSTGVAAHPDFDQARVNAMLELIERDSVAVHWYGMLTPPWIPEESLPVTTAARKQEWQKAGWEVYILDLTLDLTPICMVLLINHNKYPVLSSGAASSFTMDAAIQKAFLEAEYMALSWQKERKKKMMIPNQVRLPDDHGLLYATNQYFSEVEHLLNGSETQQTYRPFTLDEIVNRIEAVTIRLDEEKYPLAVVRVLSQHLLPLTFGYESEHYGHQRLKMLQYAWNRPFPSIPHIFS